MPVCRLATLFSKPGVFNYGNKFIAAATEVLKGCLKQPSKFDLILHPNLSAVVRLFDVPSKTTA